MTSTSTHDYPAPTTNKSAGRAFFISGLICSFVALVFLPIILGPVGAVLGFVGYAKGDRRGLWGGIFGIVATFVGMAIGYAVMHH